MMLGMKLKENARKIFVLSALTVFIMLIASQDCRADSVSNNGLAQGFSEPQLKRVTCYSKEQCPNGGMITASGTIPMQGRTCGARKEDIGKAVVVYRCTSSNSIGEVIGVFIVEDTGSHERLKQGSIDIYRDSLSECYKWVKTYGDYCFIQLVEGANG